MRSFLIVLGILVLLPVTGYTGYSVWMNVFWKPDIREIYSLLDATASYHPVPKSSNLVYFKNYWGSGGMSGKPRSMCFVFQYPEKDFLAFENHTFPDKNIEKREGCYNWPNAIPTDEGCADYRANLGKENLTLFKEHADFCNGGRGAAVYVDEKNKIVMFETYLFD